MGRTHTRREFLGASAAAGLGVLAGRCGASAASRPAFKTRLHKAMIRPLPDEKALAALKAAGFEGIECRTWNAGQADAERARRTAEKLGMRVHSVLRGWTRFNDPKRVDADVASVKGALATAKALGADAVLLVPCRIRVKPTPRPWEFDVAFDPETGRLRRVVKGDNAKFAAYIEAHDRATAASREALKRLVPAAEKAGVTIAVENVWNDLWVTPELFAAFVRSASSRWVRAYFDIGNHVKYAPPTAWVRALGETIVKCHVKDFRLNADGHGGRFVNIREGSVDWPAVRRELERIGYNGWMTIEGGRLSPDEASRRLDLIIGGR